MKKTGLSLGILFAFLHFLWVLSVAIFGEEVNFIAKIHFINPFSTLPFSLWTAVLGVILAFVSGLLIGLIFIWTYNKLE